MPHLCPEATHSLASLAGVIVTACLAALHARGLRVPVVAGLIDRLAGCRCNRRVPRRATFSLKVSLGPPEALDAAARLLGAFPAARTTPPPARPG